MPCPTESEVMNVKVLLLVTNAITLAALAITVIVAKALALYLKKNCTLPTDTEVRACIREAMWKES